MLKILNAKLHIKNQISTAGIRTLGLLVDLKDEKLHLKIFIPFLMCHCPHLLVLPVLGCQWHSFCCEILKLLVRIFTDWYPH